MVVYRLSYFLGTFPISGRPFVHCHALTSYFVQGLLSAALKNATAWLSGSLAVLVAVSSVVPQYPEAPLRQP